MFIRFLTVKTYAIIIPSNKFIFSIFRICKEIKKYFNFSKFKDKPVCFFVLISDTFLLHYMY